MVLENKISNYSQLTVLQSNIISGTLSKDTLKDLPSDKLLILFHRVHLLLTPSPKKTTKKHFSLKLIIKTFVPDKLSLFTHSNDSSNTQKKNPLSEEEKSSIDTFIKEVFPPIKMFYSGYQKTYQSYKRLKEKNITDIDCYLKNKQLKQPFLKYLNQIFICPEMALFINKWDQLKRLEDCPEKYIKVFKQFCNERLTQKEETKIENGRKVRKSRIFDQTQTTLNLSDKEAAPLKNWVKKITEKELPKQLKKINKALHNTYALMQNSMFVDGRIIKEMLKTDALFPLYSHFKYFEEYLFTESKKLNGSLQIEKK